MRFPIYAIRNFILICRISFSVFLTRSTVNVHSSSHTIQHPDNLILPTDDSAFRISNIFLKTHSPFFL
ncbi:MAG: hypothetical protein UX10_C0004G0012 [Candidatus Magasanikbacteria bacterium GW2011_GWA2_45_39]|uniref:Uncharacterized protein n=1 Tax=Candidatus Magasanikbacteria bacterium GW2011_GWA2_45_39 TaxID=1619041 RepID=A0A0G1MI41_9BACT|nr:MAG: hypothetical protein UX10_C0004G0012 [Candidatus Magasanikbacteria bacterium GW2011_GWA2_45_39]